MVQVGSVGWRIELSWEGTYNTSKIIVVLKEKIYIKVILDKI